MASDIFLISIYGDDKPWVTASVTEILGRYKATILDVGQADIHHTLSLGFLVKMEDSEHSGTILKDILFKCYELGVQVRFMIIGLKDKEKIVMLSRCWGILSQLTKWLWLPK